MKLMRIFSQISRPILDIFIVGILVNDPYWEGANSWYTEITQKLGIINKYTVLCSNDQL